MDEPVAKKPRSSSASKAMDKQAKPGHKPMTAAEKDLQALVSEIARTLQREGVRNPSQRMSSLVPRFKWRELGDLVRAAESEPPACLDGSRWFSLRLDGCAFGRHLAALKRAGFFNDSFSADFSAIMGSVCRELMEKFAARFGYTQSDEITVLVPAGKFIRGEQNEHMYRGRIQKLISVAAALVTSTYARLLRKRMAERGIDMDDVLKGSAIPLFDCRIGSFPNLQSAFALVLWRAYDCSVNSVSDAVHHSKVTGKKKMAGANTNEKLEWLKQHDLLPLARDQEIGQFYATVRRERQGWDPRAKKEVTCMRGVRERVPHSVLLLMSKCLEDAELERDLGLVGAFGNLLSDADKADMATRSVVAAAAAVEGSSAGAVDGAGAGAGADGDHAETADGAAKDDDQAEPTGDAVDAPAAAASQQALSPPLGPQGRVRAPVVNEHTCGFVIVRQGTTKDDVHVLLLERLYDNSVMFPRITCDRGEMPMNAAKRGVKHTVDLVADDALVIAPRNEFLYEQELQFRGKRHGGVQTLIKNTITLFLGRLKEDHLNDTLEVDPTKHKRFFWHPLHAVLGDKRVEPVLAQVRKHISTGKSVVVKKVKDSRE